METDKPKDDVIYVMRGDVGKDYKVDAKWSSPKDDLVDTTDITSDLKKNNEALSGIEGANKILRLYEKHLRKKNILTLTSRLDEPLMYKVGERIFVYKKYWKVIDIDSGVMFLRKLFWRSLFKKFLRKW